MSDRVTIPRKSGLLSEAVMKLSCGERIHEGTTIPGGAAVAHYRAAHVN